MTDEAKPRKKNNQTLVFVLIVLCILILGLTAGNIAIGFINNTKEPTNNNVSEELVDELNNYIAETNESIANATSDEEKAILYATIAASIYNNTRDYNDSVFREQILENAYMAEELFPTAGTAHMVYIYESRFGNQEKAKYYYDLAIERGYTEGEESG